MNNLGEYHLDFHQQQQIQEFTWLKGFNQWFDSTIREMNTPATSLPGCKSVFYP
jgi:hypothetical protein